MFSARTLFLASTMFALLGCSSTSSGGGVGSAQDVTGSGTISGVVAGTIKGSQIVAVGNPDANNGGAFSLGVNGSDGGDVKSITVTSPAGVSSITLTFDCTFNALPAPGTFSATSAGVGSKFGGSVSYSGTSIPSGSYLSGTNDKTNASTITFTLTSLVKTNTVNGQDIYTAHGSIDSSLVGGTQVNGMGAVTKTMPVVVHLDF